jgi:hypothetical protein
MPHSRQNSSPAYWGNQAALRLSRSSTRIQTKLQVGATNDPLETEADQVADRVMRMTDSAVAARDSAPVVRRACASCQEEEEEAKVQRKESTSIVRRMCPECKKEEEDKRPNVQRKPASVGDSGGPAPQSVHQVLSSQGRPLAATDRSFFEPRLGVDLSAVRIHDDDRAAESARGIGARAYTSDSNIAFDGRMETSSDSGRRLLAHELAHVVQQGGAKRSSRHASGDRVLPSSQTEQGRHVQRAPAAGGNILYIGMNNYGPEVQKLNQIYGKTDTKVTTVTVTEHEEATQAGGATYDLTQDSGIKAFVDSLKLARPTDADALKALITAQSSSDRDDLAHVISVYAQTEADGTDRMSRVVLSGHSYAESIYNEDVKGKIRFDALVSLAAIFPKAAGQTKHLLALACLAGDEDTIKRYYLKAFPNMRTFWGWTRATCPTGAGAADVLAKWSALTDKNPTQMPLPPEHQATWASGNYQTNDPVDGPALMTRMRADEPTFNTYFNGDKTDPDAHAGFMFEYYQRARTGALHTTEIAGADHDYAQLHADQSYRLRFWPGMVSNFWKHYSAIIQPCYGSATPPDFSKLSRKAALAAIAGFAPAPTATGCDNAKAGKLLNALRDLDASVLEGDWIKP